MLALSKSIFIYPRREVRLPFLPFFLLRYRLIRLIAYVKEPLADGLELGRRAGIYLAEIMEERIPEQADKDIVPEIFNWMREIIVPDVAYAIPGVMEILLSGWSLDDRLEVISKKADNEDENECEYDVFDHMGWLFAASAPLPTSSVY